MALAVEAHPRDGVAELQPLETTTGSPVLVALPREARLACNHKPEIGYSEVLHTA